VAESATKSLTSRLSGLNGSTAPVNGGARTQIVIFALSTLGPNGFLATNFPGWRTFRQLIYLGSAAGRPTYEPFAYYGLGVRARLPMWVFVLTNPDAGRRLVDVAHRW